MKAYTDFQNEAAGLLHRAEEILAQPSLSDADRAQVAGLLEQARSLRAHATMVQEVAALGHALSASAPNDPAGRFGSWAEFLRAVKSAQHPDPIARRVDSRLIYYDDGGGAVEMVPGRKQMVESVGASGGFLVPAEFMEQLQAVVAESSIVRPRATVIRMARRQVDIPVLDQTATTASQPHWFGGMLAYWSEEAAEKSLSTASFRTVSLVAHTLYGYTRVSDELLADSAISLGDFLTGPFGFAGLIAWMEDYAFLRGTGAGQPLGILNAGATISVARQSNTTPIQYADLVNMLEAFLPSSQGVWVVSQSALSNLLTIQDAAGNYVWQPNARDDLPPTLFGRPVLFSEKLPAVGTAGDVLLADFRYYLIGDREAITIDSTIYDYWRYGQTSWRAAARVDGQPWLSAPLTLADGTTQVSPFVILGNKST